MNFDPLTWMTGYGLTRVVNRVFSPTLKSDLLKEIERWKRDRLTAGALDPGALLPELGVIEQNHHPKLTALYETLSKPSIPTVGEWREALAERHRRVAATLPEAQPFFKQPVDTAGPLLDDLAIRLHKACVQDDRLFKTHAVEMQQRVVQLLEDLTRARDSTLPASHTPVHQAVLQALSAGLRGAGCSSVTEHMTREQSAAGTLMFQWRLGSRSPRMMLVDRVGGIHVNRISLILHEDSSIRLRTYDSAGLEHNVCSRPFPPESQLLCFVTWQNGEIALRINGECFGQVRFKDFDYSGPLILFGLDIEGALSADAVRWSTDENYPGLCFQKDGIWHGSVWQQAILWMRLLSQNEQSLFLRDPFAMYRVKDPT